MSTKPFRRLGPDMIDLSVRVERGAAKMLTEAVIASGNQIAVETPIDTGRASGNWQASASIPIHDESGAKFPRSSIAQISGLRGVPKKGNTKLFLSNNVPYIWRLNMGWSKQAPTPFWIERAVARVFRGMISSGRYKLTKPRWNNASH